VKVLLSKTTAITIIKVLLTFTMRRNVDLRCTWWTYLTNCTSATKPRTERSRRQGRNTTEQKNDEHNQGNTKRHDAKPNEMTINERKKRRTAAGAKHHMVEKEF
jgi:hypothetical protein